MKTTMPLQIHRRAATEADMEFLYTVYAETRREELAVTGWDEPQKEAFLRMQFASQDSHYRQHYRGASFEVVMVGGAPAGRLYLYRTPREIRIMDIALLPQFRGRGIGGEIMRGLIRMADLEGLSLTLHVEHNNPVLAYYKRLGFLTKGEHGVYLFMERPAAREGEDFTAPDNNQYGGGAA